MKIIKTLLATLSVTAMASTAAMAAPEWSDVRLFAGGEFGLSRSKVEAKSGVASTEDKKAKGKTFGLRAGAYYQDDVRAYVTIAMHNIKKVEFTSNGSPIGIDFKAMNVTLSGDYLFMPDSKFRPFIGGTVGAIRNKLEYTVSAGAGADDSLKKWGIEYGVQAGVLFPVDAFDLEIGLRCRGNTAKLKPAGTSFEITSDNTKEAYVAVSYRF